jgi:hypothetical protein
MRHGRSARAARRGAAVLYAGRKCASAQTRAEAHAARALPARALTAARLAPCNAPANTLIVSFFLALLGGMGFLSLLRNNAALCVKFSCAVQITIPTAVGALRVPLRCRRCLQPRLALTP